MRLVYQTDCSQDNEWNRVLGNMGDHMKISEGTDVRGQGLYWRWSTAVRAMVEKVQTWS